MFNTTELLLIEKTLTAKRDWLHKNINSAESAEQKSQQQEMLDDINALLLKISAYLKNAQMSASVNSISALNGINLSTKQKRLIMAPQSIKALVIDDDHIISSLLEMILQSAGIEKIHIADDGIKAISMIYDANIPYDLVLCDMNMPLKNGLDVHKAMRASGRSADTFFMLVTAVSEAKQIHAAINSGVNDYIVKPIEKDILLKKIARHFPNIHVDNQVDESA